MSYIAELRKKIVAGYEIHKEEALALLGEPIDELSYEADKLREEMCGNDFDLCTIINGKSGRCSEDCKFCAQSCHYKTDVDEYNFLGADEILQEAKHNQKQGALRFSIVTSGKKLRQRELDYVCQMSKMLVEETDMEICISGGLLTELEYKRLKANGVNRVHNNLETSRRFFPSVCSTHTYDDKIIAIKAAEKAGMAVCSGGLFGMGETKEDRIDMALELRSLNVKSIPINFLNPIAGTPLERSKPVSEDESRRIVALYRFIIPDAAVRLAGGRGLLGDLGKGCFAGGANAAISGDMLTTVGITIANDCETVKNMGFNVALIND